MTRLSSSIRALYLFLLSMLTGVLLVISSAYLYLAPNLPSVESLRDVQMQVPLRIYSADGKLISEFGEKRRSPIRFEEVPPLFVNAILAAEDDRFLQHPGVDLKGLMRAATQLIATGRIQTGGSTITMQVAKNFFLSSEKTFSRKFNEIFLALQIERELTKNEILELYINKIYLGNRAYGIQAAAQVYYGTSIDQLQLSQLAMIAGLPKAPSSFNPIVNPDRAKVRRDWIIRRMEKLGYIDNFQAEEAISSPLTATYHGLQTELDAPYVAEMARQNILRRFGNAAYTDGYEITTTIDSRLQRVAQKAVIDGLLAYDQRHGYRGPEQNISDPLNWLDTLRQTPALGNLEPAIVTDIKEQQISVLLTSNETVDVLWDDGLSSARPYIDINRRGSKPKQPADVVKLGDLIRVKSLPDGKWEFSQIPAAQAALVSLAPDDGAILSLVGGFDYRQSKFNRVTQASRQPGSNFKPLIYAAALEHGFTAATIINDAPVVFEDDKLEGTWRPANDGGKFGGPTRLRKALYQSRNLVSIRLLRQLGISEAIEYISHFGFDPKTLPHDLSLALGSYAVTPLNVARAYATFANGGFRINPYIIKEIKNSEGEVLYQANPYTVMREEAEPEAEPEEEQIEESDNLEELLADKENVPGKPPAPRIMDERVNYIINSILRDVIKRGTGRRALKLNREDIGGKTGTTNGPTDAWFSGFGNNVVTTTWLGFDQNQVLGNREFGGSAALPIWIDFMAVALKDQPKNLPTQPDGLVSVLIDPKTGKRAKPGQPDAIFEIFREEYAPSNATTNTNTGGSNNETVRPEDLF